MSIEIIGHAIVSADGRIADRERQMRAALRNDTDWTRFQAALDRAALVVLGRLGHEAHPNPGRRRLVVKWIADFEEIDTQVLPWNPAGLEFDAVLVRLGIAAGEIAVTGGQAVFDLFLPRFTRFDLVTVDGVLITDGVPCFSTGWPDEVLAREGLLVAEREELDPGVRLEIWRQDSYLPSGGASRPRCGVFRPARGCRSAWSICRRGRGGSAQHATRCRPWSRWLAKACGGRAARFGPVRYRHGRRAI